MNDTIVLLIESELHIAKHKHPDWPTDPVHAAAIVAEESGELIRAAIQLKIEKTGSLAALEREAIQTIATAVRLLENSFNYKF